MINIKTIAKVLLIALFVCAYSGTGWGQTQQKKLNEENTPRIGFYLEDMNKQTIEKGREYGYMPDVCDPGCDVGQICKQGQCITDPQKAQEAAKNVAKGSNSVTDASFCSSNLGIFSSLVKTGQTIFQRLRDLIYVVAGFGIIAVAVGGFFGNLNWKWLGAIVISLVVVATAGEIVVLITGCEQFGSSLITNTMTAPTAMSTADYNSRYIDEENDTGKVIMWNDKRDKDPSYGNRPFNNSSLKGYDDNRTETDTFYSNDIEDGNVVESESWTNRKKTSNPSQRVK